jgi:hypothetical protein
MTLVVRWSCTRRWQCTRSCRGSVAKAGRRGPHHFHGTGALRHPPWAQYPPQPITLLIHAAVIGGAGHTAFHGKSLSCRGRGPARRPRLAVSRRRWCMTYGASQADCMRDRACRSSAEGSADRDSPEDSTQWRARLFHQILAHVHS